MISSRRRPPGSARLRPPAAVESLERRLLLSASSVSPNFAITTDPGVQQFPSIAADPLDAKHLVVSYTDRSLVSTGYAGIGVAVSRDGGDSWQRGSIPLPAAFSQGAATPVTRFDDQGHVYVSFMAATFLGARPPLTLPDQFSTTNIQVSERAEGFQSNNGVFVARSDDGGTHWNTPSAIASHFYTGQAVYFETAPDIAVDTHRTLPDGSANPRYGTLYATWTRLYPPGQFPGDATSTGGGDGMVAFSKDGGRTWALQSPLQDPSNSSQRLAGFSNVQNCHVALGPEGDVYVASDGAGDFSVYHSTDGGASFVGPDHGSDQSLAFGPGFLSLTRENTLPNNQFRTYRVRAIAADPVRPGTVYATEAIFTLDPQSDVVADPADIYFARSTDYGLTWTRTEQVGPDPAAIVLNDDNAGLPPSGKDPDTAVAGQALPQLAVDAAGDVSVIWYDTRRDPHGHLLDVFGTVSTDGGQTFSPNFRITEQSLDADAGRFTDANGKTNYYIGDGIGLAVAGTTAYATWTDTRAGNQNVEFSRFPIGTVPAPLDDRFDPNNTPASATDLGAIVQRHFGRLTVAPGGGDWFRLRAAASGQITASALAVDSGAGVQIELWNGAGNALLASGADVIDAEGNATREAQAACSPGESFLVHVAAVSGQSAGYAVEIESLTAPPDTLTHGTHDAVLPVGGQAYYLATAAADGSLDFRLTSSLGNTSTLALELLEPDPSRDSQDLTVLAGGRAVGPVIDASAVVHKGQPVLVHVFDTAGSAAAFQLAYTNLDQFATSQNGVRIVPDDQGPSGLAFGDLNNDGHLDLVVANTLSNTISVFIGNGDGTFQSPRLFAIGAFSVSLRGLFAQGVASFGRRLVLADVNRDGFPDTVVTNYSSADVSVLLGRGDGTFAPQRRFDATSGPISLVAADFNRDGATDLAVVDSLATGDDGMIAALLGRGDGTFRPEVLTPFAGQGGFSPSSVKVGDFNGDGLPDLAVSVTNDAKVHVFFDNGDGTFHEYVIDDFNYESALLVGDVNADGKSDIVTGMLYTGTMNVFLSNGDGTFKQFPSADASPYFAGQVPIAAELADIGSQVQTGDGRTILGPPDGHPDLVSVNGGLPLNSPILGPPGVVVLPALFGPGGDFQGFGAAQTLFQGATPFDLSVGDFNRDGSADIAVIDGDSIHLIFGGAAHAPPPNDTSATARDLGTVVHLLEPTLTIVPGHADAWYKLAAPVEAVGGGPEAIQFSALFQYADGAGLVMEVRDAAGNVLGSGTDFRVVAAQGAQLYVHVFGLTAGDGSRGAGAYTLDIDVLPQLVSVAAPPLLPGAAGGGSANTLVLTFQGDRLDPAAAADPSNYAIVCLGDNGRQSVPLPAARSAVYDPSANVEVATGVAYPTAVKQTVTLVFDVPLAAGSYLVTLSPAIGSQPFSDQEAALLASGHPLVQVGDAGIAEGSTTLVPRLVGGGNGGFDRWSSGTSFLTQLHDDLGTLLDAALSGATDDPSITAALLAQIVARVRPTLQSLGAAAGSVLFIWLDPPPPSLDTPFGRVRYDPASNEFSNGIANAYVSVAGNVELIAKPLLASEDVTLTVQNVSATARGGVAIIGPDTLSLVPLTDPMRAGQRTFVLGDAPTGILPLLVTLAATLAGKGSGEAAVSYAPATGTRAAATVPSAVPSIATVSRPTAPVGPGALPEVHETHIVAGPPSASAPSTPAPPSPWIGPGGVIGAVIQSIEDFFEQVKKSLNFGVVRPPDAPAPSTRPVGGAPPEESAAADGPPALPEIMPPFKPGPTGPSVNTSSPSTKIASLAVLSVLLGREYGRGGRAFVAARTRRKRTRRHWHRGEAGS